MNTVQQNLMSTVLESLSKATETLKKPVPIRSNEFLSVGLNHDGTKFFVDPHVRINGERVSATPSRAARKDWLRRVPETWDDRYSEKTLIAATDFSALVLHHQWADRLIFETEDAEILYRYLLTRFFVQTRDAITVAKFKADGVPPELPPDWMEGSKKLSPYQVCAAVIAMSREFYALFMQQGTGKTPTAIAVICQEALQKRRDEGKMYRCLVVAPRSVRTNWQNEIADWATLPGKVTVIRGGKMRRIRGFIDAVREEPDCAYSVAIASYEAIAGTEEALTRIPWDRIILDESHFIKSPSAKRTKLSSISDPTRPSVLS